MSPEIAEAQSEIWAAEHDLERDVQMIEEKARIELAPAEMLRRHPLTAFALISFAAYVVYRLTAGKRRRDDENFAQPE